ncbi:MAG: hypothetical protein Q9182_006610 [Xanthomendoza sp. 2 TL-2023]
MRNDSYGHARDGSKDNVSEDRASVSDARRFTPNLHASLVSEILSLRREIESKNNTLTGLEETLQNSKADNAQLTATITSHEREIRSAKKQMQLLESGTLSALGDMAKEREDAVNNLIDARKRQEALKGNLHANEEDAKRIQALWEEDKQSWDNEKRILERKIHVTEGRLKTMINEFTAMQANNQLASIAGSELGEGAGETWFSNWSDVISTRSSSVRGRYHLSELSNNTYDTNELANLRNSTVGVRTSLGPVEPNVLSLAEELNFDGASEAHAGDSEPEKGLVSPDALLEESSFTPRRLSTQSQDCKARRILGLSTESPESPLCEELPIIQTLTTVPETALPAPRTETESSPLHSDVGTQYTPPTSSKPLAQEPEATLEKELSRYPGTENTANQRRKRVSIATTSHDSFPSRWEPSTNQGTASAACQTMPQAISPPLVPMIALEPMFPDPSSILGPEMITSSTQTEDRFQAADEPAGSREPFSMTEIPVIAIHPPGSRPGSSYNNVMLPPQTKNVACQTRPTPLPDVKSVAIQTESIRVDRRPLQFPPRTMPVAASSKPSSKPQSQIDQHSRRAVPKTSRNGLRSSPPVESSQPSRVRTRPPDIQTTSSHVAQRFNLPRNKEHLLGFSPTTSPDPFAGFSDQEGQSKEIDFDEDDDYADVAPIRKTLSKVQNSWKLVPASMNAGSSPRPQVRPISDIQEVDDRSEASPFDTQLGLQDEPATSPMAPQGQVAKLTLPIKASQHSEIRKAALISSGALAQLRRRSPSEPGPSTTVSTVPPPFPVPTRSSSRKIPISSSEGNGSPTPYTTTFIAGIRSRNQTKTASKNPLRKVRSAAAVPRFARSQSGQNKADTDSSAVTLPAATLRVRHQVHDTLRNESTPQHSVAGFDSQTPEKARPLSASNAAEPGIESPSQTTNVVDAIAQTMVGEWLWKYVRKRKSFGMVESVQVEFEEERNSSEKSSGIRHKRWVWLAPYERAIIWSSKQPTSGSALLGKGGRKLTIQSVLDVRDDTPMPKNSGVKSHFGRSILILTPQRALKFTAPSRERHNIWLTALSYLSHSTLGMEDLAAVPPAPQAEYRSLPSRGGGGARRSPRDSIRIAKSKERPLLHPRRVTAPTTANAASNSSIEGFGHEAARDSVSDAAEPPPIPRVSTHGHKRSTTGPRPGLQSAFYSFPSNMVRPSSPNIRPTAAQDHAVSVEAARGFQGISSRPSTMTRQMSESATTEPALVRNDFFDAVGTVRMEAFIDQPKQESFDSGWGKAVPRNDYRTRQGRKKDMRYWGIMGEAGNQGAASSQGDEIEMEGGRYFPGRLGGEGKGELG